MAHCVQVRSGNDGNVRDRPDYHISLVLMFRQITRQTRYFPVTIRNLPK
jgi:hypothetical protein